MVCTKGSGGRPPKSTAQHKTDGTFQASRHAKRVDAKVPPATLPCPAALEDIGRELWKRIVTTLPREVVTRLDQDALLAYCQVWQQYNRVWPIFVSDPLDKDARITALSLIDRLDKLGRQFGWTPQSRASLQMPAKDDEDADPIAEFLLRKNSREAN